jgi:hypothetical protein
MHILAREYPNGLSIFTELGSTTDYIILDGLPTISDKFESLVTLLVDKFLERWQGLSCKVYDVKLLLSLYCSHPFSPFQICIVYYKELQRLFRFIHVSNLFSVLIESKIDLLLEVLPDSILKQHRILAVLVVSYPYCQKCSSRQFSYIDILSFCGDSAQNATAIAFIVSFYVTFIFGILFVVGNLSNEHIDVFFETSF